MNSLGKQSKIEKKNNNNKKWSFLGVGRVRSETAKKKTGRENECSATFFDVLECFCFVLFLPPITANFLFF